MRVQIRHTQQILFPYGTGRFPRDISRFVRQVPGKLFRPRSPSVPQRRPCSCSIRQRRPDSAGKHKQQSQSGKAISAHDIPPAFSSIQSNNHAEIRSSCAFWQDSSASPCRSVRPLFSFHEPVRPALQQAGIRVRQTSHLDRKSPVDNTINTTLLPRNTR